MNSIKMNFYRFGVAANDTIVEEIDVVEGRNDIPKIQENLKKLKETANNSQNSLKKMMDAVIPTTASSNLKQMRNVTKSNINNLLQEAKEYINKANSSDAFTLKIKAAQDKFSALDKSTDYRTKSTAAEVNKFTGVENNILSAMQVENAKKQKELATGISKAEKEITEELKRQEKERQANLAAEERLRQEEERLQITTSKGIQMLATGVNTISQNSKTFLKHLTGAAVTFRILGGVVSGIVNTFKNLYDTAASYEEAVNLYRTALGKYAEEADQWATKISTALHLDPKDVMQYTGALYNLVQGLGVGEKAAYTMATNMTQLSYDMASYLNIDVESSFEKIRSAITGQSRAVASAGVAMQMASLQELAYSMGIKKTVSEMTQGEKTYLRYIQLMRSTTKMQQDLGKTILTPENALRVLRAEFVQFARALGQVVIPIVLKVIPYLTALADMLKSVAESVAKSLGFKMAKIDYSNFDTGNDKLKALTKNLGDVGDEAKSTRNEINRTLAPFDELNVVESESKSKGSGIGADKATLDKLEEYITGYDMLGKLTKDFDKQVENARKNLENIIPVIKKVATAFALWKLTEKIAGFANLVDKFKSGIKEGKGFGGVVKTLADRFVAGKTAAEDMGKNGISAITSGVSKMLGPIGTLATTLGLMVTAFNGSKLVMQSWNGETDNLILKLVGAGGLTAALTVTAGVFLGPWAAAGVAVAGLVGGIAGLEEALKNERLEAEKQAGFPELFKNQGIEISGAYKLVEDGIKDVVDQSTALEQLMNDNDNIKSSWDSAKEAFEQYQLQLSNGEISYSTHKEMVDGITTAVDKLKKAGEDRITKEKENELAALGILAEETNMTKEEYNTRKKAIEEYYNMQSAANNGYYDQYKKLLIQREEGTITEAKFREEVEKLQKEYLGLNTTTEIATEKAKNYLIAQNGKIDLSDPEKLNEIIKTATEKRKEYIDQENSSHQKLIDNWKAQREEQEGIIRTIEEQYGAYDTLDSKQKTQYDNAKARIDTLSKDISTAEEAQRLGAEKINSTYKNFLGGILLELAATGADQSETFKGSIKLIDGELENIGKDVDPSKSAVDFLGKYANTMEKEGKKISLDQQGKFYNYGIDIVGSFGDGLLSDTGKAQLEWSKDIHDRLNNNFNTYVKPGVFKGGKDIGAQFDNGITIGVNDNIKSIHGAANNIGNILSGTVKDELGIHSPSRVGIEIGRYFDEGFANGISDNASKIESAAKNISKRAADALKSNTLSLNIDTNVESSLNNVLSKLQTFVNNWRNAINSLVKNMKSTMNGITIDKNGKVSYTEMPKVTVKKFEDGGYPKSGDFFWANENGKAEYITSIGNRTAVANQDQMVSALSSSILTAMSRIPVNSQPSTVIVNLGNKKLYEGQGEYQNRENDRYGTTVVNL